MITMKKRVVSVFLCFAMLMSTIALIIPMVPQVQAATANQLNMAARADYMYNATWVCQKTVTGWRNNYTFTAGQTYHIPYAWPVTAGKWVGDTSYGISVDTFLSAAANANSVFYTQQSYYSGNAGSYSTYYGNDCSTFVTYCWGLSSRVTTATLPNRSGVSLIGAVNTSNVTNLLQLGDALNSTSAGHVVMVSDITYNANGAVTSIEITEQTPPQLKRTTHTVASLVSKYGSSYEIYRYSGTVAAAPEGGYTASGTNPDSYTVPTTDYYYNTTSMMKGSEVSWIQAVLYNLGYTIDVDGYFGDDTKTVVLQFQKDFGLTQNGIVDASTRAMLSKCWVNKRGFYATTSAGLNIREGAGTSYSIVTSVAQNTIVAVVGFNSDSTWANVVCGNYIGWVNVKYLSFIRYYNYTVNYNVNNAASSASIPSDIKLRYEKLTPPSGLTAEGYTFNGWNVYRESDGAWYMADGTWVTTANVGTKAKAVLDGTSSITFDGAVLNLATADDTYNFYGAWTKNTNTPSVPTNNTALPAGHGWQWSNEKEAYGIFSEYGTNGQDIDLTFDLALLPASVTSKAVFYTDDGSNIHITPTSVSIGSASVAYNWGEVSPSNWHRVRIKVLSGSASVYIDGELVTSKASGINVYTDYQLLFSYEGRMAIDNAVMKSSSGTEYFDCDFENETEARKLMSSNDGLGEYKYLSPNTDLYTSNAAPSGYGWKWNDSESYGIFHNYGTNSQNVELTVDLCLLPSTTGAASSAQFCTADGANMTVTPNSVNIGTTTVDYNWGPLNDSNWRRVSFKINNSIGYVYIDGELVASKSGITANTDHQLLFSNPGVMAIDNLKITSDSTVLLDCDFEDAGQVAVITEDSLGSRAALSGNKVSFDANGGEGTFVTQIKSNGVSLTLQSEVPTRDGYTFLGWADSASATSVQYSAGGTYTNDSAVTLYAVWQNNNPEPEALPGDVNGDQKYTSTDLLVLKRYISGTDVTNIVIANADIDGDGRIGVKDVYFLRVLLKG